MLFSNLWAGYLLIFTTGINQQPDLQILASPALCSAAPLAASSSPPYFPPSDTRSAQAARRPYQAVPSARPFLQRGAGPAPPILLPSPAETPGKARVPADVGINAAASLRVFLPASSRRCAAKRPARLKVTPGPRSRGSLLRSKLALNYIWKFMRCYHNTGNSK